MANTLKQMMTEELAQLAREAENCVLVDFRGLTAKESGELRRRLQERGIRMNVVPNKLFGRSLGQLFSEFEASDALAKLLTGPTAVVFGGDGAVMAARALLEWRRGHEKFAIKGALFDRRVIGADGIDEFSRMPTREQVIGQVIGIVIEPLRGIIGVLDAVVRNLVCAVDAIVKKQEKQGSEEPKAEQQG